MKEEYCGDLASKGYIKKYLESIRDLDPVVIALADSPVNLSEMSVCGEYINFETFWEILNNFVSEYRKKYGVKISLIKPERYYCGIPIDTTSIGGFYDKKTIGYQYWYHSGFVMLLNPKNVSIDLRTLELLRGYVHDSLHHSTFRSFRLSKDTRVETINEAKRLVPGVYREQYGINFRNQAGLSYSSPALTSMSPKTINLNLLMEGVIVLTGASILKNLDLNIPTKSIFESEILKEIFLESYNSEKLVRADRFHSTVTHPTHTFIEYWGGEYFTHLLLEAMVSGDLNTIKVYFNQKLGRDDAWEFLFKREEFSLTL